jgi:hypothetical protein
VNVSVPLVNVKPDMYGDGGNLTPLLPMKSPALARQAVKSRLGRVLVGQARHALAPGVEAYVPATHWKHPVLSTLDKPSLNLPRGQYAQVALLVTYWPGGQKYVPNACSGKIILLPDAKSASGFQLACQHVAGPVPA